jgi:hypothetical protein
MRERDWAWPVIAGFALIVLCFTILYVPVKLPGDDFLRPRTMAHRIECVLEKWGVIPCDPFRHIEG